MMNRRYKTNIIKRTLLAVMAAVTLFTSAILPSQAVYASSNVVANLGNSNRLVAEEYTSKKNAEKVFELYCSLLR